MSVLVIAAHPDDEVLGCGGTIKKLTDAGASVTIAILGEGATSRFADRAQTPPSQLTSLHADSKTAAALLGVKDVLQYGLPDNRFDSVDTIDIVKIIEDLIDKLKPSVVFTQHGGDLNVDHVVTYRATLTATRPMEGCSVKSVYAYPVASSTEWAFGRFAPAFTPQLFVDISGSLSAKIAAMEAYKSESRPFPHPRSPEALRAAAVHWGSVVGVGAAEPFEVVRRVVTAGSEL